MKRITILSGCILFAIAAFSQTIEVTRSAYLKHNPVRESDYYRKMNPGDKLTLISTEKVNGYYHAQFENYPGYIYKTFVKLSDDQSEPASQVSDGKEMNIWILDTGPALCSVIRTPNNKYIIYDAGYWSPSTLAYNKIKEQIPVGSDIELMVLSHTDGDHIAAADDVVLNYQVRSVLNTGFDKQFLGQSRTTGYKNLLSAFERRPITKHINLHEKDSIIVPGNQLTIDGVKLTFLCGFGSPLAEWEGDLNSNSMKLNAVSIVMELEYDGIEVLFTGDAVGRKIGGAVDQLIGTEHWLINNARPYLKTDILIAPHHGADNGSSTAFIEATLPESVIFSAGHDHDHPTANTAERYLKVVDINNIYRTDRGDNEGGKEWDHESSPCEDPKGDDDILIKIENGSYSIQYKNPNNDCGE